MKEKAKQFAVQTKQRWKAAAKKTKLIVGAVVLAAVAALGVIALVMTNQPYTTLFSGLNQSDMTGILAYFSDNSITDYRVEGDAILVPESQAASLMAKVLVAGYPSSGYDYDTYLENVGALTTESERNQLVLYDLQDYMAAVICNMEGVESAEVLLTPGQDNTYVLDSSSKVDATAGVQVTMENGKMLTDGQVKAIRNLVSHGLQGLNVENVVIEDTYGNSYTAGESFTDIQDASALKLQLEEQYNNLIRTRVMQVLLPLYGEDNVSVSVNTVVDLDRSYTESTDYSLEDWAQGNDDGIIGTQVYEDSIVRNDNGETAGGEVGTDSNADLPTYVDEQTQPDGTEQVISSSGQTEHLVDTTNKQVERVAGYISDVMVSVSINESAAGAVEPAELYTHVGRAAGISSADQASKISILVSPFYTEQAAVPPTQVLQPWMLYAAAGAAGLIILLILLTLVLIGRGRRKKRKAAAVEAQKAFDAEEAQRAAAAAAVQQANSIMELQTERSMELRQDIRKFAEENPEIAAQMVKNWLRDGDMT